MNASTKTRSALRAALKQEDASISERLREDVQTAVVELLEKVPQPAVEASESGAEAKVVDAAPPKAVEPEKTVKAKAAVKARAAAPKAPQARPAAKPRTAKPAAKAQPAAAEAVAAETTRLKTSVPAKGKATKKAGGAVAKAAAAATAATRKEAVASPAAAQAGEGKKDKREKVVRDSFSMPASEHRRIKALREQLGKAGRLSSKSEVLRAGLFLLGERSDAELAALLDGLPPVTKGKRSKKH